MPKSPAVDQRAESVTMIPIGNVHPAPDNPRKSLGDLTELAESIKAQGILQPLVVTPDALQGHYMVVLGHRRRGGGELAELKWLPCIVRDYDQAGRMQAMLVENLQREDLTALEEAEGFQKLADTGLSQRDISARIGRSQGYISRHLTLLRLPETVRAAADSGQITKEDAFELTKLAAHPERIEKVAASRDGWAIKDRVRRELEQLKVDEARTATLATLAAASVKVVELGQHGVHFYGRKEKPLKGQGRDYESIPITVAKHKAEKCHAAVIDRDGQPIYICVDPTKHPELKVAKELQGKAEQAQKTREENKIKRAADAKRAEVLKALLGRRFSTTQLISNAALILWLGTEHSKLAAELLELEGNKTENGYTDWSQALRAFAAKGPDQAARAVMALAIAGSEKQLRSYYTWGSHAQMIKDYFELLKAAGHQLADIETDVLGKATGAVMDDEVATCRVCGCTEDDACEGGCSWVDDPEGLGDLCSSCLDKEKVEAEADIVAPRRRRAAKAIATAKAESEEQLCKHCGLEVEFYATIVDRLKEGLRAFHITHDHRRATLADVEAFAEETDGSRCIGCWLEKSGRAHQNATAADLVDDGEADAQPAIQAAVDEAAMSTTTSVATDVQLGEVDGVMTTITKFEPTVVDEDNLPEPQPCPVCKRMVCAHSAYEKHQAASGVAVS